MPKFSIVIASFNRLKMLKTAVESVFNQQCSDWELIIVNDCSSDGTKDYIDSLANEHKNIFAIHNNTNLHKGGARNKGITQAKGTYICFLDDDDYYLPNHLSTFEKNIEIHPEVGLFFTMPISEDVNTKKRTSRFLDPIGEQNAVAYLFHHNNGVPTPRACIKSEVMQEFNPNIKIGQDTELFMRIAAEAPIKGINEHTMVQVRHDDNSGALKNNTGLDRLSGYKFIFENKRVMQHIPRKLKRYMISYCYRRMTDHYTFVGNKWKTFVSALLSVYYSPFDKDFKIKMVAIIYNFPLIGGIFEKINHRRKQVN